jgi:cytochrome c oxidase subunit I+III
MWLLGFSFIEVAAIAAAVELIVGSLKCRPPGMRIHLMPLYVWYVLVAAVMILFAFPPLIAGSMLLEVERAFNWPFFDPTRGGDPLLWQHLFWLFGHPEVYIIFLPSIALVAMIVPTFARAPIVGYGWIVLAAIGTGFLSFGLWVHHMYTTGLPGISLGLFSAASAAVAIPTGVQFFCFIATLLAGRVTRSVAMLFVLGGLGVFVLGGLTGVMVAIASFDFQAHDSFFVVAHFHYVLIGGALFPIFGGLYYFFPIAFDKQLSERLGRIAFWIIFIGFNIAFLPMHLSGLRGMPLHERDESLWRLAASPLAWAGHLLLSYCTAAIWCEKVAGRAGSLSGARVAIAIYTAGALLVIVGFGWRGYKRHALSGSELPHDAATPEDRHRFLGFATLLLSGLSALAVLYQALAAVIIGSCR